MHSIEFQKENVEFLQFFLIRCRNSVICLILKIFSSSLSFLLQLNTFYLSNPRINQLLFHYSKTIEGEISLYRTKNFLYKRSYKVISLLNCPMLHSICPILFDEINSNHSFKSSNVNSNIDINPSLSCNPKALNFLTPIFHK